LQNNLPQVAGRQCQAKSMISSGSRMLISSLRLLLKFKDCGDN
jgi:hypothetical protein